MRGKSCRKCGIKLIRPHFNQVKCIPCKEYLNKYPDSTMTKKQTEDAKKMIGIKNRHEIARELGVSLSSLKRAFRGTRFPQLKEYDMQTVMQVCKYYEKHGKVKTQLKFPHVSVRSIVERHKIFTPRCVKWKDTELIELVKMQGIVSLRSQAKYFNRPNANEGSIVSAYHKRVTKKINRHGLHGMYGYKAEKFVKKECPFILTSKLVLQKSKVKFRLYLWCDMENHLNENTPEVIKQAIGVGSMFQKWLFKTDNPRHEILKMIKERELNNPPNQRT